MAIEAYFILDAGSEVGTYTFNLRNSAGTAPGSSVLATGSITGISASTMCTYKFIVDANAYRITVSFLPLSSSLLYLRLLIKVPLVPEVTLVANTKYWIEFVTPTPGKIPKEPFLYYATHSNGLVN